MAISGCCAALEFLNFPLFIYHAYGGNSMCHGGMNMQRSQIEQVLANWIALAAQGELPTGTDAAHWIATNFVQWWRSNVDDLLSTADYAVHRVRQELERLGGWRNETLGEALHELVHATDALRELRTALGWEDESDAPNS